MDDTTYMFTLTTKRHNADAALHYWHTNQDLVILEGRGGGYAVTSLARSLLFPGPAWTQTSPEEIEAYLNNDQ